VFRTITILAASAVLASGSQATTGNGKTVAVNAVQRQADRIGKDRWSRTDPASSSDSTGSEEDADNNAAPQAQKVPVRSPRELNGKLHLGDW